MGKKKFFDKKKSATFHILARDSSDPNYANTPGSDRVFVRVDNNPYNLNTFGESTENISDEENFNSVFADAPGDVSDDEGGTSLGTTGPTKATSLPDHVRREILELGFPDDGYNYLIHMREIKKTGGGSMFFSNPKATFNQIPHDVKAYDASRVQICQPNEDSVDKLIYNVAAKTVGVKIQKAVDPDVSMLLDDSDLSRFGSDAEDLEEDFVFQANFLEETKTEDFAVKTKTSVELDEDFGFSENLQDAWKDMVLKTNTNTNMKNHVMETGEEPRARRILDDQFDLLEHQEYYSNDEDDNCHSENEDDNCHSENDDESLADKLKNTLVTHITDDLEFETKYKVPEADILRRCAEYGKHYENAVEDNEQLETEESSDESNQWDCETILSTYSNLDNHPGKIEAPENLRKKKLVETHVISLRGKQKLPVDFFPRSGKSEKEMVRGVEKVKTEVNTRKRGEESKNEKKERKVAVKEERREARRVKKEMKDLYRGEAQRAQRVAAVNGPSSRRLM